MNRIGQVDDRRAAGGPSRIGLAGAAALALLSGACDRTPHRAAPPPRPVAVATAERADIPDDVEAAGRVQASDAAVVRAQVQGQIVATPVPEGREVARGAVIARIDPRPFEATLAQDAANVARDRAALANAELQLARDTPLAGQGLVSGQQLDERRSTVAQLRAAVAADRAAARRDRLQLDFASVRAPFAGVTGIRRVDQGNLTGPNDPSGIVTIARIRPISVLFVVPQATLARLRAAQEAARGASLAVTVLGEADDTPLDRGRLTVVDNQVDASSGTLSLKAAFPNRRGRLWPGQAVRVRLVLATRPGGVAVPAAAVLRDDQGAYVYLVAGGRAVRRPVRPGRQFGERVAILQGVAAGQTVVTDGQFDLTPGVAVRAVAGRARPKNTAQDSLGLTP